MYTYDVGTSGPYINYREVFARSAGLLWFTVANCRLQKIKIKKKSDKKYKTKHSFKIHPTIE